MFRSRDFSTETLFIHIADQRTDLVKRKAYHSTPIFLLAFRQEETRVVSAVAFYFFIFTRCGFDSALGPIWSIKVSWVQIWSKIDWVQSDRKISTKRNHYCGKYVVHNIYQTLARLLIHFNYCLIDWIEYRRIQRHFMTYSVKYELWFLYMLKW